MSFLAWALAGSGALGAAGWITAYILHLQIQSWRHLDEIDAGRATRAENSAVDIRAALMDRVARLEAANDQLAAQLAARNRRLADLARGNPELAREFLRGVLSDAAASVSGDPAAAVPGQAATPTGRDGPGGDRK